jgi:hypothetical protein
LIPLAAGGGMEGVEIAPSPVPVSTDAITFRPAKRLLPSLTRRSYGGVGAKDACGGAEGAFFCEKEERKFLLVQSVI